MTRLLLSIFILCTHLGAAEPWPDPPVLTIPQLNQAPAIGGAGFDPLWQQAVVLPDLVLSRRDAGVIASDLPVPTEVRLGWTSEALFMRVLCAQDDGWNPAQQRDDEVFRGDCFEWFIDPVGDSLALAEFQFSPSGVIFDQQLVLTAVPQFQLDGRLEWPLMRNLWAVPTWNAGGVRAATRRTDDGWLLEVVVPASDLLVRTGGTAFERGMRLRSNLVRVDYRPTVNGERPMISTSWSPIMYGCPHFSHGRLGVLQLGEIN